MTIQLQLVQVQDLFQEITVAQEEEIQFFKYTSTGGGGGGYGAPEKMVEVERALQEQVTHLL